ncbi:RpoL/Rpb11 RNA polymerase subunit family protein [Nanoarchaeota archaeon]
MELKILNEEKDKLVLEVEDKYATFASAIKSELWNDQKTKVAAVNKKHPLVGKPEITVEGPNPKSLLTEAAKRLQKDLDKFKKDFSKEC